MLRFKNSVFHSLVDIIKLFATHLQSSSYGYQSMLILHLLLIAVLIQP